MLVTSIGSADAPAVLPQDLALIMEMVQGPSSSTPPALARPVKLPIQVVTRDTGGPGSPAVSVSDNEVEDLLVGQAKEGSDFESVPDVPSASLQADGGPPTSNNDDSDSEDDDSSSSSSSEEDEPDERLPASHVPRTGAGSDAEDMDDEPAVSDPATFASKNEIVAPQVVLPDIEEIGADETIENIGEIMSIVDSVVVIKGRMNTAYQVIDTGSLLVFEDRRVLGLVFETFGAVTQPMYSVRFPSASAIDKDGVRVSRNVFHVPQRSHYVFTRHLLNMKGSDASNMHDEEIPESDVEFSDDEKEAEFKRSKKRSRREYREAHEEAEEPGLFYGESPLNGEPILDPRAERAAPAPYDEEFGKPGPLDDSGDATALPESRPHQALRHSDAGRGRARGAGRGRGDFNGRGRGGPRSGDRRGARGRGRGRGRGGPSQYPQEHPPQGGSALPHRPDYPEEQGYDHRHQRELSPTSYAIARATGQWDDYPDPSANHAGNNYSSGAAYSNQYEQQYDPRSPEIMQPHAQFPVAPHINPRFPFGAQGFSAGPQGYYAQYPPQMFQMQQMAMMGGYNNWGQMHTPSQQMPPYGQSHMPHSGGEFQDEEYEYGA